MKKYERSRPQTIMIQEGPEPFINIQKRKMRMIEMGCEIRKIFYLFFKIFC